MSSFPPLHGQSGSGSGLSETSYGVWGDSDIGAGVIGTSSSSTGVLGQNDLSNGIGVTGEAKFGVGVFGSGATGVQGGSNDSDGVLGGSRTGTGVHGQSGSGYGVYGESLFGTGIYGSFSSTSNSHIGTTGIGTGVYGFSSQQFGVVGEGTNAGIAAFNPDNEHAAYLASDCCAAYFVGEVAVIGHLSKSSGGFLIDHPLDPANKHLSHSFVESPDMKNIYDGVVVLDANGEGIVELPAWFEHLNTDFRYQLTCIGGYAPVYIAQEVQGNRFKIAGGTPNIRVSWQVTGIRQDAWANAHRIQVEEEKSLVERGNYLHPELHGAPKEKSIERVRHPQRMQQVP